MDQCDELILVGAAAQEINQCQNGTNYNRYKTQCEEELSGHHKAWNEEAPNLIVACSEGVVDPATADKEACLANISRIG